MDKIKEMELGLLQAKKQARIEDLLRQQESYREALVGKCSATHTLRRKITCIEAGIVRCKDVEIEWMRYPIPENKMELELSQLEAASFTMVYDQVMIRIYPDNKNWEIKVSEQRTAINYWRPFRNEITEEEFWTIHGNAVKKVSNFAEGFRDELPKWSMCMTNGEAAEDKAAVSWLETVKADVKEISKVTHVQVLQEYNHPFLYGTKLLISHKSGQIVKQMEESAKRSAQSWLGSDVGIDYDKKAAMLAEIHSIYF